ncbi:MAG: hypothetical protein ACOX7R_10695 [Acetivibrionales bacterium]|jgi:hypothetical protein
MNPWLFSFIVSFILLIVLFNRRELSINICGGIICAVYMLIDNFFAYSFELFKYNNVDLGMPGSVLFSDFINIFFIGIAFNMGIIFFQLLPERMSLQFLFALVLTIFFGLFKYILMSFGLINYINFRVYFVLRLLLLFLTLAWFKTFYLKKKLSRISEIVS